MELTELWQWKGSLGAWLASEFGVHITADQLLAAGADLNEVLP